MRLSDLCPDMMLDQRTAALDIAGLTADSRAVKPGYLFAALKGSQADGRRFLPDAVDRGAIAVLAEGEITADLPVAWLSDSNARRRLALMAAAFYERQPKVIAAVTGTSGKTSVAHFTQQLWAALGIRAASLGTLGLLGPGLTEKVEHTTPDPISLHQLLAKAAKAGCEHLALEASSHGLDQFRLDGVRIAAAAFTNLSRDHMDYHPTVEEYFAAKMRLFGELLPNGATAVINMDSDRGAQVAALAAQRGLRLIRYGRAGAELKILKIEPKSEGLSLGFECFGTAYSAELPLIGAFQAGNALAALGLVIGCGAEPAEAAATLGMLTGVPGRMQFAASLANGAAVFVDYAHKPDALQTALMAARPHASGELVLLFGCGGDRDRGKRPLMGEIAARLADRVYVTDDNPRTEEPAAIRAAIMEGCPDATEIGDRREAIRAAVASLEAGDVLLLAGKGHEQGQIIGLEVRPFDDAIEAHKAVALIGGGKYPGISAYGDED